MKIHFDASRVEHQVCFVPKFVYNPVVSKISYLTSYGLKIWHITKKKKKKVKGQC